MNSKAQEEVSFRWKIASRNMRSPDWVKEQRLGGEGELGDTVPGIRCGLQRSPPLSLHLATGLCGGFAGTGTEGDSQLPSALVKRPRANVWKQ